MREITDVICEFQNEVRNNMPVLHLENWEFLGSAGLPTRGFFLMLGMDPELVRKFCMESEILKNSARCITCSRQMSLINAVNTSDKKQWYCGRTSYQSKNKKKKKRIRCKERKSLRWKSWFTRSHMNLQELLLLTYEIVMGTPAARIREEYGMSMQTIVGWRQSASDVILSYVESNNSKVGGFRKLVEVDMGKSKKVKYELGLVENVNWAFGGVERNSGKAFIIPLAETSAETLIETIKQWIEPGTTVIMDSWREYMKLSSKQLEELKVKQNLNFVEELPSVDPSEESWRLMKERQYNKQNGFSNYFAEYVFRLHANAVGEDPFVKFMDIVRKEEW